MTEPEIDHYESYLFACSCLRVERASGRKLSPKEMIERVDEEEGG